MNDMIVRDQIQEPQVQVVFASGENLVYPLAEVIADTGDDAATISDADMIARVARWADRDVRDFDNLIVTRPATGNILIAPKPVYG